ncbi:MAG: SRPBCC domain-containing protein [Deltaproteobacteria bacterium]|nr:SRPBCC domain-containing protein [Deltaproteobacteria bacterium]
MKKVVVARSLRWVGSLLLAGCGSVPPVGDPSNRLDGRAMRVDEVHWPEQYEPEKTSFFVTNVIDIEAPPELVWEELMSPEAWPSWYEGAENVKVLTPLPLRVGSEFRWETMGLEFVSKVHELDAPYRLSWESRKTTIKGYHAWVIVRTAPGSRVITEESQVGFLTAMQKIFVPNKLRRLHDIWLAKLKERAEAAHRTKGNVRENAVVEEKGESSP